MKRNPPLVRRLAQLYGDDSEKLLAEVHKIAFGEAEVREPTDLDGTLDKVMRPSMRERLDALELLLSYAQGRPISHAEVAIEERNARTIDYDRLTFSELQALDALSRRAHGLPAPSRDTGRVGLMARDANGRQLPSGTVVDGLVVGPEGHWELALPAGQVVVDAEFKVADVPVSTHDEIDDADDEEPEE